MFYYILFISFCLCVFVCFCVFVCLRKIIWELVHIYWAEKEKVERKILNSLTIYKIVLEGFSKMESSIYLSVYPSNHTYRNIKIWNYFLFLSYVILKLASLKHLFSICLNPIPQFVTWLRNHFGRWVGGETASLNTSLRTITSFVKLVKIFQFLDGLGSVCVCLSVSVYACTCLRACT